MSSNDQRAERRATLDAQMRDTSLWPLVGLLSDIGEALDMLTVGIQGLQQDIAAIRKADESMASSQQDLDTALTGLEQSEQAMEQRDTAQISDLQAQLDAAVQAVKNATPADLHSEIDRIVALTARVSALDAPAQPPTTPTPDPTGTVTSTPPATPATVPPVDPTAPATPNVATTVDPTSTTSGAAPVSTPADVPATQQEGPAGSASFG